MAVLSKRERLECVIHGEQPDRIPVALWRHWPGDDQDAESLAAAHIKWQADYDWDFVKVGPSSSYTVNDWGMQDRWVGHIEGTREPVARIISRPEQWASLRVQDPARGMLGTQVEALRLVGKGLAPGTPFLATIFSPLSQVKYMAGEELLQVHLRQYPDALRQGLRTITDNTLGYIEQAKKSGIAGIYYAVQHTRYTHLSPAEYVEMAEPYDMEIMDAVSDLWLNLLHVHGLHTYLHTVASYPVALVNWHDRDTGTSLAQGMKILGRAVCGGISQWSLHEENPAKALAEAADAVQQSGGRQLVLATGCVSMTTTPLRNIRALRAFVETGTQA